MIIPATHDSGFWFDERIEFPLTYDIETDALSDSEEAKPLKEKFEKGVEIMSGHLKTEKHTYTQYYNFQQQLDMGVRLFDLRFKLKNKDEENPLWIIHHGPIEKADTTIFSILDEATRFIKECTEDFLIED